MIALLLRWFWMTSKSRRSELLDNAAERVHFVLIQREAMKLSRSETFFEDYEVPDEVQARLGQREC